MLFRSAYPINNGFYVHTMSFAVTSACGEVDWRFIAPTGTIVLDGVITSAVAERSGATGGGDHMAVILHRQTFNSERLHMDAGFTPQGKTFVRSTLATGQRCQVCHLDTTSTEAINNLFRRCPDHHRSIPPVTLMAAGIPFPTA